MMGFGMPVTWEILIILGVLGGMFVLAMIFKGMKG